MASPSSTCFRKNGLIPVCKRGDQEKLRHTPSGREKGQFFFSNISIVDVTLTTFFSVFQMSILEVEDIGESTPQGVALFLVSCESENGKEQESMRVLRMYNLSSLISLAKWAISRKVCRPLFIGSPTDTKRSCRAHHHWTSAEPLAGSHIGRHRKRGLLIT